MCSFLTLDFSQVLIETHLFVHRILDDELQKPALYFLDEVNARLHGDHSSVSVQRKVRILVLELKPLVRKIPVIRILDVHTTDLSVGSFTLVVVYENLKETQNNCLSKFLRTVFRFNFLPRYVQPPLDCHSDLQ